jgi:hypothetical protein
MTIKVLYNSELLIFKITDFDKFDNNLWNELEKEFGFSIRNATYEIWTNDIDSVDTISIYLNHKGYNQYKEWKSRLDRLDDILYNL